MYTYDAIRRDTESCQMGVNHLLDNNEPCQSNNARLYYSAFAANLAYFSCGCSLSWTSPSLPKLYSKDSLIHITEAEGSWAGSLLMLGGSLGAVIAGPTLDCFGRKRILQGNTLLLLIGWIVLASANTIYGIYFGRFLQGIAVAIYFTAIPIYLGEISEKNLRAALASCSEVFVSFGYMLEYSVGPYVSYTSLAYTSCVLPIISFILLIWIPESPFYLLSKGKKNKAIRQMLWLRGSVSLTGATEEIALIQDSLDSNDKSKNSYRELFTNRVNLKALYLANGLLFLQQFSGINVVLFYAQPIFMKSGASFSSSLSAIIVGAVQLISAGFTPPLVKRYGFKIPLMISAAGMAVAQGLLGYYFFMESNKYDLSSFNLIPVSCLVMYIHLYCLGFGPVPWAVVGELFSPNIKSTATSISTSFSFFLAFIITKFFTNLSESVGAYAAFWLFSVWCILAFVFVVFFLPNTKGLSLMEIQELLNGNETKFDFSTPRMFLRNEYSQIPQELDE